jgi:drug/metabolite transporter (DMT)-like permease
MPAIATYLLVILIWSTTPLAIKWGNDSISPIAAVSLRISLAVMIALLLALVFRRFSVFNRKYYPGYLAGSVGIFPNLALVYYAAETIPSGLIAVLFGLSPFITGVAAHFWLDENLLTPRKCIALMLALSGLVVIFLGQMALGEGATRGVLLMVGSATLFSISSVWVKRLGNDVPVPAFDQTIGTMTFSLPGLLLAWYLLDGQLAVDFSMTSLWSLLYLSIVASLIGFVAFFYVLTRLGVGPVSLIPLITPVLALWIGSMMAGELITLNTKIGTLLILSGLFVYEGVIKFKTEAQ